MVGIWNSNRGSLPACRGAAAGKGARRTHILARLKSKTLHAQGLRTPEDYAPLIQWLASSAFYCGENDRGWRADLDFLVRSDDNVLKLLERRENETSSPPNGTTPQQGPILPTAAEANKRGGFLS